MKKLIAPWTADQVDNLNRFQTEARMHPFTCGQCCMELVARRIGWHCSDPDCDYTQQWAHPFMANPDAWPVLPQDPQKAG